MASGFFKKFAIDNNLTADYGYIYGKYKGFYITIKETLGSQRILTITTTLGKDKEKLKKVLSVFEDELYQYHINDMKREETYLQFSFNLSNEKVSLVAEFLDKFIESYTNEGLVTEIICPICNKPILEDEKIAIVDIQNLLTPVHESCYNKGKDIIKEKVDIEQKEINKGKHNYGIGFAGALVFSLIYMALVIAGFFFVQFILKNANDNVPFGSNAMSAQIFQYAPVLIALAAAPLIYKGYELFKGKEGSGKFLIIMFTGFFVTEIAILLGFIFSLVLVVSEYDVSNIFALVFRFLRPSEGYITFRRAFYIYLVVGGILSFVSLIFPFSSKKEQDKANASTFDKLD